MMTIRNEHRLRALRLADDGPRIDLNKNRMFKVHKTKSVAPISQNLWVVNGETVRPTRKNTIRLASLA